MAKIKAGWRSTEFWGGLLGAIGVSVLVHLEIMTEEQAQNVIGVVISWILGRSYVKGLQVKNGNGG